MILIEPPKVDLKRAKKAQTVIYLPYQKMVKRLHCATPIKEHMVKEKIDGKCIRSKKITSPFSRYFKFDELFIWRKKEASVLQIDFCLLGGIYVLLHTIDIQIFALHHLSIYNMDTKHQK